MGSNGDIFSYQEKKVWKHQQKILKPLKILHHSWKWPVCSSHSLNNIGHFEDNECTTWKQYDEWGGVEYLTSGKVVFFLCCFFIPFVECIYRTATLCFRNKTCFIPFLQQQTGGGILVISHSDRIIKQVWCGILLFYIQYMCYKGLWAWFLLDKTYYSQLQQWHCSTHYA